MREIVYKYVRGSYYTQSGTKFGEDTHLKITVEPHDCSISVGGEVLHSSKYAGCFVVVSNRGEVEFFDCDMNPVGRADEDGRVYAEVRISWRESSVDVEFGYTDIVDYYPNCDGEYDRYGSEWIAERIVTLSGETCSIKSMSK